MRINHPIIILVILSAMLVSTQVLAQKYHSANDNDVEFSLEEKNQGPKPFYIDQEAILKAKRAQYDNEKKEAKWMAKKISALLAKIDQQKIDAQNKMVAERTKLAQVSLNSLPLDVRSTLAQQNEQAKALLARAKAQQNVLPEAIQNTPKGTEVSRALASLEPPVIKAFKHHPKRSHAKKLWKKFASRLKNQTAYKAKQYSGTVQKFFSKVPAAVPVALLPKTSTPDRRPAGITPPQGTNQKESLWQGVTRKISSTINSFKAKFFNW